MACQRTVEALALSACIKSVSDCSAEPSTRKIDRYCSASCRSLFSFVSRTKDSASASAAKMSRLANEIRSNMLILIGLTSVVSIQFTHLIT